MSFLDEEANLISQLEERARLAEAKYEQLLELLERQVNFYDTEFCQKPPLSHKVKRVWYIATEDKQAFMFRDYIENIIKS